MTKDGAPVRVMNFDEGTGGAANPTFVRASPLAVGVNRSGSVVGTRFSLITVARSDASAA